MPLPMPLEPAITTAFWPAKENGFCWAPVIVLLSAEGIEKQRRRVGEGWGLMFDALGGNKKPIDRSSSYTLRNSAVEL